VTYDTTAAGDQRAVGEEAQRQEHAHPAAIHTHDHYHVTHHHSGGVLDEFEHRAHYHSHEHNHAPLVHGHEHDVEDEAEDHAKEAHIHDHNEPAGDGL
jgi:hypothetical protein